MDRLAPRHLVSRMLAEILMAAVDCFNRSVRNATMKASQTPMLWPRALLSHPAVPAVGQAHTDTISEA